VRSHRDEETDVAIPPEEHPQVIVATERLVVGKLARELQGPHEGILRIRRKATERRPEERIPRFELPSSQEAGRGDDSQRARQPRRSASSVSMSS
jgi:hypothetical protein